MNIELSPKQCEFINNATHRYNGKIGATQCGKTHIDIAFVILDRLMEREGKKGLNLILGVSKETIERNVLEPMRDMWGEKHITAINNRNICHIFGIKVYCIGAEKVSQVSKLRGAKFKYVYIDEIVDINQEVFQLLKSRLSLDYSVCDFTGNPSYPSHWVKEFIDSDADVWCQGWTLYDNPFLAPSVIKAMETEFAGTVYFDRYVLGKWKAAEGAIYRRFVDNHKPYIISAPPKGIIQVNFGVDYGGAQSKTAFFATGFTRNYKQVVFLDEECRKALTDNPERLEREFVDFCQRVKYSYPMAFHVYGDSAETTLNNGIRTAAARERVGVQVNNALKGPIVNRVRLVNKLLAQKDRLKVMDTCPEIIKAMQDAVWDDKALEDVRLDNGTYNVDVLDAMEYTLEPVANFLQVLR